MVSNLRKREISDRETWSSESFLKRNVRESDIILFIAFHHCFSLLQPIPSIAFQNQHRLQRVENEDSESCSIDIDLDGGVFIFSTTIPAATARSFRWIVLDIEHDDVPPSTSAQRRKDVHIAGRRG